MTSYREWAQCFQRPLSGFFWANRMAFASGEHDSKAGFRKVFLNVQLNWKWDKEEIDLLFKYAGFSPLKIGTLYRTYVPDGILDLTRDRFQKRVGKGRKFFSVGFNFGRGAKKGLEKTGDCLSGISFFYVPNNREQMKLGAPKGRIVVHIAWRATELTRRFVGDLVLIDEIMRHVLGDFYKDLTQVTMSLASLYVTAMHWPTWTQMFEGAEEDTNVDKVYNTRLKAYRERDPKSFKYGPAQRAAVAYGKIEEQELLPLFALRNGLLRVYDGGRKYHKPIDARGGSSGKEGR